MTTISFAELNATSEAHRGDETIVLTDLGQTTSTLFRLKRLVRGLSPEDCAVALAQLRAVLADLETPPAA